MTNTNKIKTFLRWAGNKSFLLNKLLKITPSNFKNYHEPFLGSGAVYFSLDLKKKVFLSDYNSDLINTFVQIRDNIWDVIEILKTYKNTNNFFLTIRENIPCDSVAKAARFIYLNRTCYNGLYRVNSKGKFNVPFAYRKNLDLVRINLLKDVSLNLQNTEIFVADFFKTNENISKGDFVFIDPPYAVSGNNNGFLEYNEKIFSWADQIRLKNFLTKINNKGVYFIMSNAKHKAIRKLYSEFKNPIKIKRYNSIGGKGARRGMVEEYLFKNF